MVQIVVEEKCEKRMKCLESHCEQCWNELVLNLNKLEMLKKLLCEMGI